MLWSEWPPLIFNSSRFISQDLKKRSKDTSNVSYSRHSHVSQLFQFSGKKPVVVHLLIFIFCFVLFSFIMFYLFLSLFLFSVYGPQEQPNSQGKKFYFLVNQYKIWCSGWDSLICLYPQIPKNFIWLILKDAFGFVHILHIFIVTLWENIIPAFTDGLSRMFEWQ